MNDRPTALAADVFAGGFSLGVQRHFDVLAHFEENDYGFKTARHNFPKMPIYVGFDRWPVDDFKNRVDFVFANPPCAAWSPAGHSKERGHDKWKLDPRKDCTVRCLTLRKRLRPKVYATESVTQAWSKGREFFEPLMKEAADDGYSTTVLLHDAQHLGLPQSRKRVFFIFHRVDFLVQAPNWSPPPVPLDFLPDKPVGSPMIEKPYYFTEKRIARVKPGERLSKFWERTTPEEKRTVNAQGGLVGRPAFGHVRLPIDEPGGATVGYCIIHPTENRFLSTEEIQLLSGFPPEFFFTPKGANARAAEIARGVCPTVAEWLAKQVLNSIQLGKEITDPNVMEVDFRRPPVGLEDTQRREVFLGSPERETPPARTVQGSKPKAPRHAQEARQEGRQEATRVASRPPPIPRPKEGLGSGKYIKLMLDMERYSTEEIVAAVHMHYPSSKATGADVAYHRGEMREAGRLVATVRVNKAGERKLVPYRMKETTDG